MAGDSKLGGLPGLSDGTAIAEPAPVANAVPNYSPLVSAFDNLASQAKQIAQPVLDQQAEQAGDASVTRDAQGNLQAPQTRLPINDQNIAYNNAAQLRYLSETALDVRPKIAAYQVQFASDPVGFRNALDGLTQGALQNAPSQFQPAIRDMIEKDGTQALAAVTEQKFKDGVQQAHGSVLALIEQDKNTLAGYARSNTMNDPRAQAMVAEVYSLYDSLSNNPAFNLSPQQITQEKASFASNLKAEAFRGQADTWYQQFGEAGAEQRLTQAINDPSLNLSETERNGYLTQGLAEIRMQHALSTQNSDEAQRQVEYQMDDAKAQALATGDYSSVITDDEVRMAYANNPARANQIIETLHGAAQTYSMQQAVKLSTPAQLAQMKEKYNPANAPQVQTGSKATVNLANNNPGNMKEPGSDTQFQSFPTMQAGIDAVGQQINLYRQRGIDTIGGIVSTYAPAQDHNNVAAYVSDVAQRTGIPANQPLTDDQVASVRDAMITHEQGGVPPSQLIAGGTPPAAGNSTFAAQQKTYQAFQSAVNARNKALLADPAGYVLSARPDILAQVNSTNPDEAQNGVRALLTNERDLGAPQQILSGNQVNSILGQFNNPPDPTKRADNAVGILSYLQQKYGSYYPQVMSQLSSGMPADVAGLDWVKGDPTVAPRMANAINTGAKTLEKIVPDAGDVRKSVLEGLSDFNGTVRGPGSGTLQAKMADVTTLYAYQLVSEGASASTAATQAVHDIVGKNYTFADTYRVPAHINAGTVARGVQLATDGLTPANVEPYAAAAPGISTAQRQNMSANILKSQGVWLTQPNDGGLYLAWPAQTGYLQARNAQGQPIQYSWSQLSTMAQTHGGTATMPASLGPKNQLGFKSVGDR